MNTSAFLGRAAIGTPSNKHLFHLRGMVSLSPLCPYRESLASPHTPNRKLFTFSLAAQLRKKGCFPFPEDQPASKGASLSKAQLKSRKNRHLPSARPAVSQRRERRKCTNQRAQPRNCPICCQPTTTHRMTSSLNPPAPVPSKSNASSSEDLVASETIK